MASFHLRCILGFLILGLASFAHASDDDFDCSKALVPIHVVGYSQNAEGKIVPVYSQSNEIQSVRRFRNVLKEIWQSRRVMMKIPLVAEKVPQLSVAGRSESYDLLPEYLRSLFESGHTLVTRPARFHGQTAFSLLMATAPKKMKKPEGRTGILLFNNEPVIVNWNEREYLVELKGAGAPEGGFDHDYQENRGRIRGGLESGEAKLEFQILQKVLKLHDLNEPIVLGAAMLKFKGDHYDQALLIRLVPGSVRASFRGIPSYRVKPDTADHIVHSHGEHWGRLIAQGMIPVSHLENLISLEHHKKFVVTDYADVVPVELFPYEKRSPLFALRASLNAQRELLEYRGEDHFRIFLKGFMSGFRRILPQHTWRNLVSAQNSDEMAEIVWKEYLAFEYYKKRSESGWLPEWYSHIEELAFKDLEFCFQFQIYLIQHFMDEIDGLLAARELASEHDRHEIQLQLDLLVQKNFEVRAQSSEVFQKKLLDDPDYWIRVSALPFHTRRFDKFLFEIGEPQYQRFAERVQRVFSTK